MGAQHFPRYTLDTKKMSERSPFWCISQPQVSLLSTCPPSAAAPLVLTSLVTGAAIAYSKAVRLAHGEGSLPGATPGAALPRTRGNARGGGPWAPRPTPMPHVRASAQHPPGSHTLCQGRNTRCTYPPPSCSAERILIRRSANWANDPPPNGLMISQLG
jgi:hypothetical protein